MTMQTLIYFQKPDLEKSYVKAHTRKLKDGRRVEIAAYYDKRARKGSELAPAHGHNLAHLVPEEREKFDAMHKEHHLLTFYQGHALKKRIGQHERAVQTLKERAVDFERQGAHKAATKLHNKALRHESDLIRHRRALGKVETATNWLANEKEKRVQGSGALDMENADFHHARYVDKLGSPWKPMKTEGARLEPDDAARKVEGAVYSNGQWKNDEKPIQPTNEEWAAMTLEKQEAHKKAMQKWRQSEAEKYEKIRAESKKTAKEAARKAAKETKSKREAGEIIPYKEMPPGVYAGERSYVIETMGRKWLELKDPSGKYHSVKAPIDKFKGHLEIGDKLSFPANVHIESNKYGQTTTVYPLYGEFLDKAKEKQNAKIIATAEKAEAERKERNEKSAKIWIGWIDRKSVV